LSAGADASRYASDANRSGISRWQSMVSHWHQDVDRLSAGL
jgi:hypothetical protein